MRELGPWLALIFRRLGRLVAGGILILATLLAGMGLLALSGWFITATALSGILLAAGVQASIQSVCPWWWHSLLCRGANGGAVCRAGVQPRYRAAPADGYPSGPVRAFYPPPAGTGEPVYAARNGYPA